MILREEDSFIDGRVDRRRIGAVNLLCLLSPRRRRHCRHRLRGGLLTSPARVVPRPDAVISREPSRLASVCNSASNRHCGRMRATERAARVRSLFERRHGLAEIVERGAVVFVERRRRIRGNLMSTFHYHLLPGHAAPRASFCASIPASLSDTILIAKGIVD